MSLAAFAATASPPSSLPLAFQRLKPSTASLPLAFRARRVQNALSSGVSTASCPDAMPPSPGPPSRPPQSPLSSPAKRSHLMEEQTSHCWYGRNCLRRDCWHTHPDGRYIDEHLGNRSPLSSNERQRSRSPKQAPPSEPAPWTEVPFTGNLIADLTSALGRPPLPQDVLKSKSDMITFAHLQGLTGRSLLEALPLMIRASSPPAASVSEHPAKEDDSAQTSSALPRQASASASPGPMSNNLLAKVYQPSSATAKPGDPVYSRRGSNDSNWPTCVDESGNLTPYTYTGTGWPMHFCNPDRPRAPINKEDVQAVRGFLVRECGISLTEPIMTAPAVIQMTIGFGRGGGCVQIYTTKLGREDGNCRVAIKSQNMLIPIRATLLKSAWFHDALETGGGPYSKKLEAVFHPEGKLLLPPLSSSTDEKALNTVMRTAAKKLGKAGKAAMKEYLTACNLQDNSMAMAVLSKAFGD